MATALATTYPPLTTIWTKPASCSTHWTYAADTGTYYVYITQDWQSTERGCRPPHFSDADGTYSPGICPNGYTTWSSTIVNSSITSAHCCPSGYINQGPECASLYTTTTSLTVASESVTTAGTAPPGTAVLSGVHILYQSSDLSLLPTSTTPANRSSVNGTGQITGQITGQTTGPTNGDGGEVVNGGGLGKNTIIGIAVGCAVAALLLIGAAVYIYMLRRKVRATQGAGASGGGDATSGPVELDPTETRTRVELSATEKRYELSGDPHNRQQLAELQGSHGFGRELVGNGQRDEKSGTGL